MLIQTLVFLFIILGIFVMYANKILKMMEEHRPAFLTARFLTWFRFIMMVISVSLTTYMFSVYGNNLIAKYSVSPLQKTAFIFTILVVGFAIAVVLEVSLISSEKTIGYIDAKEKAIVYLATYIFLISINIFTMLAGLNKTTEQLSGLEIKKIESSEKVTAVEQKRKLLEETKESLKRQKEDILREKDGLLAQTLESAKLSRLEREKGYLIAKQEAELSKFVPISKFPTKRAGILNKYKPKIAYWENQIGREKAKLKAKIDRKVLIYINEIQKIDTKIANVNQKLSNLIDKKINTKESMKNRILEEKENKFSRNWKIVFFVQFFNLISGVLSSLLIRLDGNKNLPSPRPNRPDGNLNPTVQKEDDEESLFNLVFEVAKEESEKEGNYVYFEGKQHLKHISRDRLKTALQQKGISWKGNYNEFYARYSKAKKDFFHINGRDRLFKDVVGNVAEGFSGVLKI